MTIQLKDFPTLVRQITVVYDGWIIGSAANPQLTSLSDVRDVDVICSYEKWREVSLLIINSGLVEPNTFGGWKIKQEGVELDIWPDTLDRLVPMAAFKYAWHPKSNKRIGIL